MEVAGVKGFRMGGGWREELGEEGVGDAEERDGICGVEGRERVDFQG